MGRRVVIIAALLASFLGYEAYANVYASNIRIAPASGAVAKITFALNDSASVVNVVFKPAAGGAAVRTIVLSDIPFPGDTSVVWDGKTDGGAAAPGGMYYVDIEARQLGGVSTWTQAWENEVYGDHITTGLSCRDVEVNTIPTDRNFGFIDMTESTNWYMYSRMLKATAFGNFVTVYDTAAGPYTNTDPWYMTQTRDGKIYTTLATKAQIRIYNDVQLVDSFTVEAPAGLPGFSPTGIAVASNGTIYVGGDRYIYRLTRAGGVTTIVGVDSFPSIRYFRDLAFDDGGSLYATGGVSASGYKTVYKLGSSPAAPVLALIDSVAAPDYATHLAIFPGTDLQSNSDDIYYVRARGTTGGVFQINWTAHTLTQLFQPATKTSPYHSIATDIVGNVYYANPSGEWVRMYAPPTGPNSYTTRAIDQVTIPGGGPTPVPISEARKDLNGDFVPDHKVLGDTLLVYGVITTPNFNGTSSTSYYMQDATAGVNLYKSASGSPAALSFDLGDSIMVIGKIDQYNGLTELVPLAKDTTKIKVVKKGATLPTPVKLSVAQYIANGEQYESMLIELDSLRKASTSPAWPGSGLDANLVYTSFNKADTVTIRFDKDTDVPGHAEPSTVVSFTGVATQFIRATPPAGGYQLTTRFWATDVKGVTVGVQELPKPVPEAYYLKGNYPNPFNPTTTVEFGVPRDGMVQIAVYNVLGQQVEQLANEYLRAGAHRVVFDARSLVTGTYFCVMKADGRMFTQKMLLVK